MAGYVIQQMLNGLVLAGVYALLAVAFALVHAVTRRIVFTLGDLAMYAAFYAVHVALLAVVFDFASLAQLLIAFAAAGLGTAALAFLVQRLVVGQTEPGADDRLDRPVDHGPGGDADLLGRA